MCCPFWCSVTGLGLRVRDCTKFQELLCQGVGSQGFITVTSFRGKVIRHLGFAIKGSGFCLCCLRVRELVGEKRLGKGFAGFSV